MTTQYYRVFLDETEQRLIGLYRRRWDASGRGIGTEAYHPRHGWKHTDYWLRTARGEPDEHLVEVPEDDAWATVLQFDAIYEQGDPQAD